MLCLYFIPLYIFKTLNAFKKILTPLISSIFHVNNGIRVDASEVDENRQRNRQTDKLQTTLAAFMQYV